MRIQIGPCCLVQDKIFFLNFKLKNEASRANLNKNKRIFKWGIALHLLKTKTWPLICKLNCSNQGNKKEAPDRGEGYRSNQRVTILTNEK